MRVKIFSEIVFVILITVYGVLGTPINGFPNDAKPNSDKDNFRKAAEAIMSGNYDQALLLFDNVQKERIDKYGENSVQVANVLVNLGVIKSQLGQFDQAIGYYLKAEKIYLSFGKEQLKNVANVRQNLAICYNEMGDIEKALNFYENAKRVYQEVGLVDGREYTNLMINLAVFNYSISNFNVASELIEKSFLISSEYNLDYQKWNTKGMIFLKTNEYQKGIDCFKMAIKVGERDYGKGIPDEDILYMNLGLANLSLGDYDTSLKYYNTAKEIIKANIGEHSTFYSACLNEIGQVYLKKSEVASDLKKFVAEKIKNTQLALSYFQEALMAVSPNFDSKDFAQNPSLDNIIDNTKLLDALRSKADALKIQSELEEKGGDNMKSLASLKKSLETYGLATKVVHVIRTGFVNQESRLKLAEAEHPVYLGGVSVATRLYELTDEKQYFEKAFEFSERSRSTDFQTMIRDLHAKQFGGLPDSLLQKERDMVSEIAAYENFIFTEQSYGNDADQTKIDIWKDKLFALHKEHEQMIDLFEQKYPRYYNFKYADPVVSLDEVQRKLSSREALIEYVVKEPQEGGNGELIVFVIKDNDYEIYRRALDSAYGVTVNSFLAFLKSGLVAGTQKKDYQKYVVDAFKLNNWLIAPFSSFLQDYRLIIVPDEKLSYLPFDAFVTEMPDLNKMDFRNLKYLVYDHSISYTYSATLLYYYFNNKRHAKKALAAFAPDYFGNEIDVNDKDNTRNIVPRDKLFPLPGAKQEVAGVTKLISGDLFTGENATVEKFKSVADQYDILHLAMHTVINDSLPMYSKLVFSQDGKSGNSGCLDTYEIYSLPLKSRMAVLSACNTGTGRLQRGEGVMSLARGFLYSGCPSIIMTLWNVEDVSSSELMIDFYKNLKNGDSKDEALRKAKIRHIQSADPLKAHPYYWLGYVSVGSQIPLYRTNTPYFVGMIIFVLLAIIFEKYFIRRKAKKNL